MSTVYEQFGLTPVINAAGKLTALGGSAQSDAVAAAQQQAALWHVDLQQLREAAGARIATLTGAEAASITPGAAAGIAISVAACITGSRLPAVLKIPDSDGLPNKVLLQAGHNVNFGASVEQMIRLGGGRATIVGWSNSVPLELLERTFADTADVAAFLYVQSHHASQDNRADLPACAKLCRQHRVPLLVDAAAEEDLQKYISTGADLVTYSGGKAFGGPTVGFIAGRRDLIEACEMQQRGFARAMKVGKEQIIGLLTALDQYASADATLEQQRRESLLAAITDKLVGVRGLQISVKRDDAGRPITRLAVQRQDGGDIRELVRFLGAGTPSIRTRNHHLDDGFLLIDPREINSTQADIIASRLLAFGVNEATP